MSEMIQIEIQKTTLHLLSSKAIYWPEKETLILADLHLGKVTHFRKSGIGLPPEVENDNFERLSQLIFDLNPTEVLILGDLFHSHHNHQWQKFTEFVQYFDKVAFVLVMGNHDILPQTAYEIKGLSCIKEVLRQGPFIFSHHPIKDPEGYNLCGHIHPGVRMKGKGLQSVKLPCFHFGLRNAILPAFGAFTGTAAIKPVKEDKVYAIAGNKLIQVL